MYFASHVVQRCSRDVPVQHPRITARFTLLAMIATVRCVYLMIEQPLSSLMRFFPYIHKLAIRLNCWKMVSLPFGCFIHLNVNKVRRVEVQP